MTLDALMHDPRVADDVAVLAPDLSGEAREAAHAAAIWSCLIEPGDGTAGLLVSALGVRAALEALAADDGAAARSAGIDEAAWGRARERWMPRVDVEAVRWSIRSSRGAGMQMVIPTSPLWPGGLDDLAEHAPICLWVRGDPTSLPDAREGLAVVGARAATSYGEHVATDVAGEVAARGTIVISGAAYGIDGAAHRAALAVGGRTIAVLAGGVDRAYPTGNADLLGRIARTSAVIAEVPFGAAPTRWRFLQRNRLIAAMAAATLVVEAGARSGSLNTAGHAAQLGRALGAVPGPITSAASAGCHRLMREFDATCITSSDDALELVGWVAQPALVDVAEPSAVATRVLDALSRRVRRTVADIARRSGLSAGDVSSQLGLLELDGAACAESGGWRRTG